MRPTNITIKRDQTDTYDEVFSVDPIAGSTSIVLTIDGLGSSVTGTIDTVAKTVTFAIDSAIANGAIGAYDYIVVQTIGGLTRTIINGEWIIHAQGD